MNGSWFRRHPDGTLCLVWFGGGIMLTLLAATVPEIVYLAPVWAIAVYLTATWVLRVKGRSLWWLALLGLGLLITLFLENKTDTEVITDD